MDADKVLAIIDSVVLLLRVCCCCYCFCSVFPPFPNGEVQRPHEQQKSPSRRSLTLARCSWTGNLGMNYGGSWMHRVGSIGPSDCNHLLIHAPTMFAK